MKNRLRPVLVTSAVIMTAAVIFIISGCEKPPLQQISKVKAEIEAIENAEGTIYAAEELRQVNEDLEAALAEIESQGKNLISKNYEKAKEMLAKVKSDAENLKMAIPMRKNEVKNNAAAIQNDAKAKIDEARGLLAALPEGKLNQMEKEAFEADLKGMEDSLNEIQQLMTSENYFQAIDKARVIHDMAGSITQQLR